jgi:hypothetical protein
MRTEQRASRPGETGQRLKGEVIPMERLAVASAVLVVLVGFGGCARDGDTNPGTGPGAVTPATTIDSLALCRQALPARDVVSATPTTVGDLRTWGYSGPVQQRPLLNVFPSSASSEPAAWCWTREAVDSYAAWGAHATDAAEHAITLHGPTNLTPSGPPIIP